MIGREVIQQRKFTVPTNHSLGSFSGQGKEIQVGICERFIQQFKIIQYLSALPNVCD